MAAPFDPLMAPLLGTGAHLPRVEAGRLLAPGLRELFQNPPLWTPEQDGDRWPKLPESKPAAVLVPIFERRPLSLLLTQRTSHLSSHAGQISFPGGRQEAHDADPVATALREAEEEIGLAPSKVEVLGSLPVYTTVTGFAVTPVVALVRRDADLRADPHEVAEIFEVPFEFLMNPAHHQRRGLAFAGAQHEFFAMPWTAPATPARDYFIWGATAAILRNLYRLLAGLSGPPESAPQDRAPRE